MNGATTLEDVWALFRETDRLMQQSKIEADERYAELTAQVAETNRQMKETDKKFKELAEQAKRTDLQLGAIGNSLGEFVERLVAPSCLTLFVAWDIPVTRLARNLESSRGRTAMELDLVAVDTGYIVVVEVKTKPRVDDVKSLLKKLPNVVQSFPEYAHLKVVGCIAGMVVSESVATYAQRKGLFVLIPDAKLMKINNHSGFKPRYWS
ncbi:MAG: hypothetical protein HQL60_07000 [Magnetococcales bacterium]|nr:hypothetical protein [Magnetococcales bacterium]